MSIDQRFMTMLSSFFADMSKERPCQKCGKCCVSFLLALAQNDLDREPKLLSVSIPIPDSLRDVHDPGDAYVRMINTTEDAVAGCPFYIKGTGCSIYDTRPDECRNYKSSNHACLRGRLFRVGFDVDAWYDNCFSDYCETRLHRMTGLDPITDCQAVYLYSMLTPYLVSEKKVIHYYQLERRGISKSEYLTVEGFINADSEIPHSVRSYLQLDGAFRVIRDLFSENGAKIVKAKAADCCRKGVTA